MEQGRVGGWGVVNGRREDKEKAKEGWMEGGGREGGGVPMQRDKRTTTEEGKEGFGEGNGSPFVILFLEFYGF
jgi:hypothetical protein